MTRAEALIQLRDIRGLPVSEPLVPGSAVWWLLLLGGVVLVLAYGLWRYRAVLSWRIEARQQLRELRCRLRAGQEHAVLAEFSSVLRRIAMARKGRQACAGLCGAGWLAWLQAQDPNAFPWTQYAEYLTEARYAPPETVLPAAQIDALLQAAMAWTQRHV